MDDTPRERRLKNFTDNMVATRKHFGWTQEDLAERLKEQGLKFYPQTVQKIETGERRIQLAEAIEIARVLGYELDDMLDPVTEGLLSQYQMDAEDAGMRVSKAVQEFFEKQLTLAGFVDQVELHEGKSMREGVLNMLDATPDEYLEQGREAFVRHEQEKIENAKRVNAEIDDEDWEVVRARILIGSRTRAEATRKTLGLPSTSDVLRAVEPNVKLPNRKQLNQILRDALGLQGDGTNDDLLKGDPREGFNLPAVDVEDHESSGAGGGNV